MSTNSNGRHIVDTDSLWAVGDAARYLGVTKHWVYKHCTDGTLPHRKIGNRTRFIPSELRGWADAQKTGRKE